MPRVSINKIKYKRSDFVRWLAGEMIIRHVSQKEIAGWLGISQSCVSQKMQLCSFSYTDMLTIFDGLETPKEEQAKVMLL